MKFLKVAFEIGGRKAHPIFKLRIESLKKTLYKIMILKSWTKKEPVYKEKIYKTKGGSFFIKSGLWDLRHWCLRLWSLGGMLFCFQVLAQPQALEPSLNTSPVIDKPSEGELELNLDSVKPKSPTIDNSPEIHSEPSLTTDESFFKESLINSLTAKWRPYFEIKYFNDQTATNTAITKAKIYAQLNWELNPSLSFYSKALFIGTSGTTSSLYGRADRQKGLHLLSAVFTYKRNSAFSINFGNIQQSFLQAPLLITDKTFSSLKINWFLDHWFKKLPSALALVQLSIPSNAEQVQNIGQIIKGFPLFAVASLQLKNFSVSDLPFKFFNYFNLWMYYNIPPAVVFNSRVYGNLTDGQSSSESIFLEDFYGLHNHWGLKAVFSQSWAGDLAYEYIKNLGSAEGNQGDRLHASLYYNYQDFVEIKGTLEYFKNQHNSAIAFYNSEIYGHNNRKGFLARIQFYFYESGVSLGASAVFAQSLLNPAAIGDSISAEVFLTSHYLKIK